MKYFRLFSDFRPLNKQGPEIAAALLMGANAGANTWAEMETNKRNQKFQSAENEKARQFNHDEAEIARTWAAEQWQNQYNQQRSEWYRQQNALANMNRQQFLFESQYNSPQNQVQRLRVAGLNPGAMFSQGGSGLVSAATGNIQNVGSISVPTGGSLSGAQASTSPVSMPQMSNPMKNFSVLGTMLKDLASAAKTNKEADILAKTAGSLVTQEAQKAKNLQLINEYQGFQNWVKSKTKDKEVEHLTQQVANLYADNFLKLAQGSEANAHTMVLKSQELLNKLEYELKGMDLVEAKYRIANLDTIYQATIELQKAQAASARANAALSSAQAQTENESRDFKVNLEQINRDIARLDWRKKFNETFISNATTQSEVKRITAQAVQAGIITKTMETQLKQAIFNKDWQLVDKIFGMVIETANTASRFVPGK